MSTLLLIKFKINIKKINNNIKKINIVYIMASFHLHKINQKDNGTGLMNPQMYLIMRCDR